MALTGHIYSLTGSCPNKGHFLTTKIEAPIIYFLKKRLTKKSQKSENQCVYSNMINIDKNYN